MYIDKTKQSSEQTELQRLQERTKSKSQMSGKVEKQKRTASGDAVFRVDHSSKQKKAGVYGSATYERPVQDGADLIEDIENQAGTMDAEQMKNSMLFASQTTSPQDYDKLNEDGFSLNDTKIETVVTETDKIKLALAKAGVDISAFGDGLSKEQIEAMTGSVVMANELTSLGDGAIKYMLDNELTPSIENLYKAEYSGSAAYTEPDQPVGDYTDLMPEITRVIEEAGLEVNDQTIADSEWLIENEIPLTADKLSYYTQLQGLTLPPSQEQLETAVATAVAEGNTPQDALLIPGYSMTEQAEHGVKVLEEATDEDLAYLVDQDLPLTIANLKKAHEVTQGGQKAAASGKDAPDVQTQLSMVTARRQLEEARLAMTAQANYSLLKQGISIDTKPLAELVDALKEQEDSYYSKLLSQSGIEASEENVAVFRDTMQTTEALKTEPAYALTIQRADETTLAKLEAEGKALQDVFEKAGESYETMMTTPRSDLGDSIKKAFANVDDILKDLGLETTPANERAVRILAYNEQAITEQSVLAVKAVDETVQQTFKNLSPSVVLEMIREGINPLDMNLEELNQKAVEIREDQGTQEEERFSKYLWKLEQNQAISEEERSAYIGIYRLIRQVEKTDGAAIGSLMQQQGEMTMRNLLTQVRSGKHSNREYTVDDDFGGVDAKAGETLSITDQIEKGYYANQIHNILNAMTPQKMQELFANGDWEEMTPEQLAEALESADEEYELDHAYAKEQLAVLDECAKASEEAYQMLEAYDMPATVYHVMAAEELLENRNKAYQKFFGDSTEDGDTDLAAVKEEILQRFAEAVKTPEDMAEAQKALADTAENVMKTMIIESDQVSSLDLKAMKLLNAQISLGTAIAKEENYAIPVLVGDEVTNVSLKIVRGKEKKGMVDILFSTDITGKIAAQLRATEDGIRGYVVSDTQTGREWLEAHAPELEKNLQTTEHPTVQLDFVTSEELDLNRFGKNDRSEDTTQQTTADRQVQTKELYHMAEAFLTVVKGFERS